jgi:hypothetical protein
MKTDRPNGEVAAGAGINKTGRLVSAASRIVERIGKSK